jgi:hypothetical protein
MRVTLTESGGWTNVRRQCSVDTDALPREVAKRLEACMKSLLEVSPHSAVRARDAATLVFEVDGGAELRRAYFSEAAAPPEIGPVLEILRPYCQPLPNQGA